MRPARAFLAIGGLLVGCGSSAPPRPSPPLLPVAHVADAGPPPPPPSEFEDPPVSPAQSRRIARTLRHVAKLRHVTPKAPVPGVQLSRTQLVERVKRKAMREYPADTLRREGQVLELLGFAPAGFDYLSQMMKLLEAQLEGFYEPKNGTMYLASDLDESQADATLAHELVHALQDQHWDLKSRSEYRPGKGDETLALAALAEGDATSAMMDFMMEKLGATALDAPPEVTRELMQSAVDTGEAKNVPHILRMTLIAPYVEGVAFVNELRREGGFAKVDAVWRRPPVTTEQVLHVVKWESAEPAIPIAVPAGAALGAGWKMEDEDTYGELGFALTFGEWMPTAHARAAASDWGGDRAAVWVNGEQIAFAVHVRYDPSATGPDAFAIRAFAHLEAAWKKEGSLAVAESQVLCRERPDLGPLLIARKGADLVITAGPATMGSPRWSSSSTCARARAWAREILAQP